MSRLNLSGFLPTAMTVEDFEKAYPQSEFEHFTQEGIKKYLLDLQDEVLVLQKSEDADIEEIEKALQESIQEVKNLKFVEVQNQDLMKSVMYFREREDDLEKGGKVPIGTIHNGYKKVSEGKWNKVSLSHGLTKKEHLDEADKNADAYERHEESDPKFLRESIKHEDRASKLDDKDYSEEHVLGAKKPTNPYVKSSPNHNVKEGIIKFIGKNDKYNKTNLKKVIDHAKQLGSSDEEISTGIRNLTDSTVFDLYNEIKG